MSMLTFRYDEDLAVPPGDGAERSSRLWVSDQQWLAILERAKQAEPEALRWSGSVDGEERRDDDRLSIDCKCLLRWSGQQAEAGAFAVGARNISTGGLCFLHGQSAPVHARCTLAIQPPGMGGMILGARVAWCKEIDLLDAGEAFEVGVRFDRAISLDPFTAGR